MKWLKRTVLLLLFAAATACWLCPFPGAKLEQFPSGTIVVDRAGRVLRVGLGPHDEDCRPVYIPTADDWIVKAIVAAEDERFWRHPGIDPLAILRAAGQNLLSGKRISGASTISTQVIRLLDQRPRTLRAKLVEAFWALKLERRVTKLELMRQYLNRAPFGGNIVGIESAAQRYFGKSAHDLSLAEASLLAGLPQSPSRLRPDRHIERARRRQTYVLRRMVETGAISEAERDRALAQDLACRPTAYPFEAPHFVELAIARAPHISGVLRTTLDSDIQRIAEAALQREQSEREASGIHGGAVVVLEVGTGAIRAMVGSPNYFDAAQYGQVNGALARRSAGSTLKPFAFAQGFDRGLITPLAPLNDAPRSFSDFTPSNFDGDFHGLVAARNALILSLNLPAIDLEERIGQREFYDFLRTIGLRSLDRAPSHYGLGLVLGNGEVRLLDLANAYAALARGGEWLPARWRSDAPAPTTRRHVASREAAWLVADALSGQERAIDATGHAADVRLPRIAWKTGTSSGLRDAWTIAWNPDYVVAVWIGNADSSSAPGLVGKLAAAPVAWNVFRQLLPANDAPWFEKPEGLGQRLVCVQTGLAAGPQCERTMEDYYLTGVTPYRPCAGHGKQVARETSTRITAPANGATFKLVEPTFGAQRLVLAATAPGHWFVDQDYIGEGARISWPLARGPHQIAFTTPAGRTDRVAIWVE